MTVDAAQFRHALGQFASGVTVVTMAHDGESSGLTVSAFSSLSLHPPYVLVCIDKSSTTLNFARRAASFTVNILSEEQQHLSNHFASKLTDKLITVPHHIGQLGNPILEDTVAHLECRLEKEIDGGDHVILIGEVMDTHVNDQKQPLLYHSGHYGLFQPS